jgi:hypothetical protein
MQIDKFLVFLRAHLRVVAVGRIGSLSCRDGHVALRIRKVGRVAPAHNTVFSNEVEFIALDGHVSAVPTAT